MAGVVLAVGAGKPPAIVKLPDHDARRAVVLTLDEVVDAGDVLADVDDRRMLKAALFQGLDVPPHFVDVHVSMVNTLCEICQDTFRFSTVFRCRNTRRLAQASVRQVCEQCHRTGPILAWTTSSPQYRQGTALGFTLKQYGAGPVICQDKLDIWTRIGYLHFRVTL